MLELDDIRPVINGYYNRVSFRLILKIFHRLARGTEESAL